MGPGSTSSGSVRSGNAPARWRRWALILRDRISEDLRLIECITSCFSENGSECDHTRLKAPLITASRLLPLLTLWSTPLARLHPHCLPPTRSSWSPRMQKLHRNVINGFSCICRQFYGAHMNVVREQQCGLVYAPNWGGVCIRTSRCFSWVLSFGRWPSPAATL
jgi:hypothetical protein